MGMEELIKSVKTLTQKVEGLLLELSYKNDRISKLEAYVREVEAVFPSPQGRQLLCPENPPDEPTVLADTDMAEYLNLKME